MPWLTQLRIEAGLESAGPFGREFTKTAFLRGSSEVLRDAASSEGVLCVAVATCNCTVAWTLLSTLQAASGKNVDQA